MAVDVATIVGDWDTSERLVTVPGDGLWHRVLEPNPRRFAIGFAVINPQRARLRTTNNPKEDDSQGFELTAPGLDWWWLSKHGPFVALNWWCFGVSGGINLTVWELVQSPTAGEVRG